MKILTIWIVALLLGACAATRPAPEADVQRPPDWFYSPDIPGYLGFATSAPPQAFGGIEAQQRVAEAKARAELGRMAGVQVQSRSQVRLSDKDGAEMQTASRESSAQMLDLSQMEIREWWLHPTTGDLYIWVVVPKP